MLLSSLFVVLLAVGPDVLSAAPSRPLGISIPLTKRTPKLKTTKEIHAHLRRESDRIAAKYGAKPDSSRKRASSSSEPLEDVSGDAVYTGLICELFSYPKLSRTHPKTAIISSYLLAVGTPAQQFHGARSFLGVGLGLGAAVF